LSSTNGYLPRSLLDELDKKKKKESLVVKANNQKKEKGTYNATSTEAVAAKKTAVEHDIADSLTASTAPKATKSDNHDVYHQVKETAVTSSNANSVAATRRGSAGTTSGSGRQFGVDTSLQDRTAKEKRDLDAKEYVTAPITKENVLSYYDRARELAGKPSWTTTERKEAELFSRALNRPEIYRKIYGESGKGNKWSSISTTLYNKTHPISTGFTANLLKGIGAISVSEAVLNGLEKLIDDPELAEIPRQQIRELNRMADYGRQEAPVASEAGKTLGTLALYGSLANLAASTPALAGASSVAKAAAVHGAASGGTAAVRELGEASTTGDWGGYAKDVGLSAGIGAASGAAAQVVHNAISDILRSTAISQQNKSLIQQDMDDVRQRYEETVKALAAPNASPEQRALLAQSTVDNANWASRRLDELASYGGYDTRAAQDALTGIVEEMKPYTAESNALTIAPQYNTAWTNGLDDANIHINRSLPQSKNDLIQELVRKGTKFSERDMLFITRDATGQIVWLEKGSPRAGLEHIIYGNGITQGHAEDFFRAFGISTEEIPSFLEQVISHGKVVSNILKPVGNGMGFERVYYYEGSYYVMTGIGTNGYIVSAYPIKP